MQCVGSVKVLKTRNRQPREVDYDKLLEHWRRETTLKGGQNLRVFVKNQRGEALMPCSQRKARLLLKEGKAKIVDYKPFTIQLLSPTGESTQDVHIGVDTGSKHIGIAVTSDDKVLVKGEIELRDGIHRDMLKRQVMRRTRRKRNTRYRKPRFLHRIPAEGWLPPSIKSKIDATYHWIDKFASLVPNPTLHIEIGRFNVSKINDTTDKHNEYNKRFYVFSRDEYTCQVCKKSKKNLRTHHILYKSKGGTDSVNNLITVCEMCHSSENHQEGGILYDWMLKQKQVPTFRDAAFMNIEGKRIKEKYPNAIFTYGYQTLPDRENLGLSKTHYNDAIAISGIENIKVNPSEYFYIKQFRKKKRSLHETYPVRGRRKEKNVNAERRNKNVPYKAGWYMNDMAICEGKVGWIYGFGGGNSGKQCIFRDINGEIIRTSTVSPKTPSISLSKLKLLCHNNNWQYIVLTA